MAALRFLLRPGPIALGITVIAFAALCFSVLAPWQLGKNSSTTHRNDLIRHAVATPSAPIGDVVADSRVFDPATEWREVAVTGTFVPEQQILLRLRSVDGSPAVEVLTPFATDHATYLVHRGYVRAAKAAALPDVPGPPATTVTINARVRASEGTSVGRPITTIDGKRTAYSIDPADAARALDRPMAPFYLQLSADQPGSLTPIALPQLETGPYLSYGLQWLAFGLMAPAGVLYFLYIEIRQRRRARQDSSVAPPAPKTSTKDRLRDAGLTTGSSQRHSIGDAPTVDDDAVKRRLADRYGRG